MRKILIYGAGGFGREVQWLIERINQKDTVWEIEGYLDDSLEPGTVVNGYSVLGGADVLRECPEGTAIACAVGPPAVRERIVRRIRQVGEFEFPNLIDPSVMMSDTIALGEGNIICAGNILTVNIDIQDFLLLNLSCTVGHDVRLDSFVTVYPGVNISGAAHIERGAELGTGSKVIQGKTIARNAIVGAGSIVVRDIPADCTAMGVPARPVKLSGGHKRLLIVGTGGHARVVYDLAQEIGFYDEIAFLDDYALVKDALTEEMHVAVARMADSQVADAKTVDSHAMNPPVLGNHDYALRHKDRYDVFVAIGKASARSALCEMFRAAGVSLVTLIHPDATVAEDVTLGMGTIVMAGAVVQSGAQVGNGVIINTGASVDHGCVIGDYSHVAVGAHIAGNVRIAQEVWIGAGSVVNQELSICAHVTVGSGAVVVRNITESGTYLGVPAKRSPLS